MQNGIKSDVKGLMRLNSIFDVQGLAIPISEEDFVLKELKEIEACTSLWATRAKQVGKL